MKVFTWGSDGKPPPVSHTFLVCPGGHLSEEQCPSSFWEGKGDNRKAKTFPVEFVYGEATVEAELGKYMIDTGLAQKTRLILPGRHA
jgi:hypothetical protein